MTKPSLDYLVLAPHATVPPHDGASLRSVELARSLMRRGRSVLLVALNGNYASLDSLNNPLPPHPERSRTHAALLGLLTGRGYHAAKLLTPEWTGRARAALKGHSAKVVHAHFLWTVLPFLSLLKRQQLAVDTHNYDPEVYRNLTGSSRNPIVRLLGAFSKAESLRGLRAVPAGQTFLHVTEGDVRRYRLLLKGGEHRHLLVPNGCSLKLRKQAPSYSEKRKQIYFLGLLSAKMNVDALEYFASEIWPQIKDSAAMNVIGRAPGPRVHELCKLHGWKLLPDISNKDLDAEVTRMHYAILPFQYAAGSKLKLLDACARGVPVISTPSGVRGHSILPKAVNILDNAMQWQQLLTSDVNYLQGDSEELVNYARKFTWDGLAAQLDIIFGLAKE